MEHEIITLQDVQIIGMYKEIPYGEGQRICPRFWGEYVERIVKPIYIERKAPDAFQKAAADNNIGEFGYCTCNVPGHNCITCTNDFAGKEGSFTYVIGGQYKGGDVPEGMKVFPVKDGKWLKVYFVGGMKAYADQYRVFEQEWLPQHPEFQIASDGQCIEWYGAGDINSPDYQCGIMLPIE